MPYSFTVSLVPVLPPDGPTTFHRGNCALREGNNQTFHGLLDMGSKLTLIPGDPKKLCAPAVEVGAYGGQVIKGLLAEV